MTLENCSTECSDTIKTLKDSAQQITLHNKNRKNIKIVRYDGCIKSKNKQCDYFLCLSGGFILVELKGKNIEKALDQISDSIDNVLFLTGSKLIKAVIKAKQYPSYSRGILKKQEIIFRKWGIRVDISSSSQKYCLEKMAFID